MKNPNPEPGPLGEKLQELRQQAGLTLYELEQRSGINRPKLLRIEKGEIRQPTIETLNKLADALDVDPEEFYDAAWAEADGPMPSLPAYFRSKYHMSDTEIAAVERTVRSIKSKQDNRDRSPKQVNERRKQP